jgi:predicted nucleic acid-binding protein
MTLYVLDTNIISLLLRQNTAILTNFSKILTSDHTVLACPMVWYELRRGLLAKDAKGQMQRAEALFVTFE